MTKEFDDFIKRYEDEFINAGYELDRQEMPELTEELLEIYENTGKRLEYEKVYFLRRKYLTVYAMLLSMQGNKKYIKRLEKVIEGICNEITWALPAHIDKKQENWQISIDLFAAETAFSLAEIICIHEKKLSKNIVDLATKEVYRRVLTPFMESSYPYAWWEETNMNWCAVCCGSIGAAAIWFMQKENKKDKLMEVVKRVNKSIMHYIDGFKDDGACLEGIGYFTYGMSFFIAYADLLYKFSAGNIDLFANNKLKIIALFQQKCFLSKSLLVSFSDSEQTEKVRIGLSAYLSKKYQGIALPEFSMAADLESDKCYRYVIVSRDYFWTKAYADVSEVDEIWHTVLREAQWSICKSDNKCAMAVKGGHNGEPHNHNDIGSFLYVCDDEYILEDLGAGEYTKDYFNERRYNILNCRSLGHNVPLVGGREQLSGKTYKASNFFADGQGKTEMEIQEAYGLGSEEKIKRIITFDKCTGKCDVIDKFTMCRETIITENLITSYKPIILADGFLIKSKKNFFNIKITNGMNFEVWAENYKNHCGEEKNAWHMQWRVNGDYSQIQIEKEDEVYRNEYL